MSTSDIDDGDAWLGIPDAARYLSVSPDTIRRRIADGSLPVVWLGRAQRVRRSDLDALLTSEPVR